MCTDKLGIRETDTHKKLLSRITRHRRLHGFSVRENSLCSKWMEAATTLHLKPKIGKNARSFVRLFALCVCVCAKSSAFTSSLSLQSCRHLLVRAFILSARTTLSETSFTRSRAADDFFRIERAMCDCVVRVHHRR